MPARKGDRPFVGLTNDERKAAVSARRAKLKAHLLDNPSDAQDPDKLAAMFGVTRRSILLDFKELGVYRRQSSKSDQDTIKYSKAFQRQSAIKEYIESSDKKVTIAELTILCDSDTSTIAKDLKCLGYRGDHNLLVTPKHLSEDEITEAMNYLKQGKTATEIAPIFGVSQWCISRIARGCSPRSIYPCYTNMNILNRGRLTFREYQVLTLIKNHPGKTTIELLKIYKKEFVISIRNTDELRPCLYRLKTFNRIYDVNVSPLKKAYYAYAINIKELRCGWTFPAGMSVERQNVHCDVTNYSSYIGKQPHMLVKFTNKRKNMLTKESEFGVEFNRSCTALNKNGIRCGGPLSRGKDGIVYCEVCGLVYDTHYSPGIDNTMLAWDRNLALGRETPLKRAPAWSKSRCETKLMTDGY